MSTKLEQIETNYPQPELARMLLVTIASDELSWLIARVRKLEAALDDIAGILQLMRDTGLPYAPHRYRWLERYKKLKEDD